MACLAILSSLVLALSVVSGSAVPLIQAPWGALQGVRVEGDGGRRMNAYLAIPYAVPPLGELRFEKPLPHPGPAQGQTFVADQLMPVCPQVPIILGSPKATSEDCLKLNVYVPADKKTDSPYAVMIFIHGGGFTWGDAQSYRPSKLVADGKVIVVVIQYRLGVFGFLSSGDDTLPGNLGLWDQNLAMRWVKDNIHAFGGDPDRITIFGESAGSMSVGLQMMSPQSRGLFQRGIMQSGAPQTVSLLIEKYDKNNVFKGLADMFECQGETTLELLRCLKEQTTENLFSKATEYSAKTPMIDYFNPCIDGEFIPQDIVELLQDDQYMQENGINDIDLIMGLTNKEGAMIYIMAGHMELSEESLYTSEVFHKILDSCILYRKLNYNSVIRKTIEFYYRGAESGSSLSRTVDSLVDMYGDCILTVDIVDWAQHLAASSHSAARYMYIFDHDFAFNMQGPVPGSHHGDELLLEFDSAFDDVPEDSVLMRLNKTTFSPEDLLVSDKFVQILTSFAKTGDPSAPLQGALGGKWPQFSLETEAYLSLSPSPSVLTKMAPYTHRLALWLSLLPQLSHLTSTLPPEDTQEQPVTKDEL